MTPEGKDKDYATMRDLMKFQERIYDELQEIHGRITDLYWKLGLITGGVSMVVSVITQTVLKQ